MLTRNNRHGVRVSLDQPARKVKSQTLTHDAFLGGRLTVSQPRHGFRAGLDSVVLGAAVRADARTVLDLGAGVGTAGLVALAHNDGLAATLVERDAEAMAIAGANIEANGFAARARTILLDVAARGAERRAAGLEPDRYDAVIANPPFFDAAAGTRAAADRADARHMAQGTLDLWVRTAATSAAPGAEIVFIYPAAGLAPLLAAFGQRFGAVTVLPLCSRPGEAAGRVLVRGIKGSRAPLTLLSARSIHGEAGRAFSPEFEAMLMGRTRLVW
jgi:tRNA1(Val) A37 N6-methylase TrmN6